MSGSLWVPRQAFAHSLDCTRKHRAGVSTRQEYPVDPPPHNEILNARISVKLIIVRRTYVDRLLVLRRLGLLLSMLKRLSKVEDIKSIFLGSPDVLLLEQREDYVVLRRPCDCITALGHDSPNFNF